MPVEVELGTYILPEDHRVFKYFPGKGYKFEDVVARTSIMYLDVRGLDALGPVATWDEDALLTHIAQDRVERMVQEGGRRPSRLVRSPNDKANRTGLLGLLKDAQKGDFILMPTSGGDVKVGVLSSRAGSVSTVTSRASNGKEIYIGRRVSWLTTVKREAFGKNLARSLVTPAAFFPISSAYYVDIYRLLLDSFVYDGEYVSTFRTEKKIFTSKDNLLTSLWFELVEVLGQAQDDSGELKGSIYDLAVASDIEEEDRNDLSILIQSPGWFRLRSITAEPLVAVALFALAAAGTPYDTAVAATTRAHTVRPADTTCLSQVDASVKTYIELLGKDRWDDACRLAVHAKTKATLSADAALNAPAAPAKKKR